MSREAMKLALEALKNFEKAGLATLKTIDAITALRQALEQPEPEPVAWVERDGELVWNNREAAIGRNLYTSPPKREPEPEPVIDKSAAIRIATSLGWTPQRKPLTDEEIDNAVWHLGFGQLSLREVARAIEAAHGIKGEA